MRRSMVSVIRRPAPRSLLRRLLGPLGEISVLRNSLAGWGYSFITPYTLDSSRVDYTLARELYRNVNDKYKLGAGFARPVINTTAGFMGTPHFDHPDPEASQALEDAFDRWVGRMLRINRNALRDGDVYARLGYEPDPFKAGGQRFTLSLIPPEWVTPVPDPLTGSYREVIIRSPVLVTDERGAKIQDYVAVERITAKQRSVKFEGSPPAEVLATARDESNPWAFIPIVHIRNEAEEHQLFGCSDLEAIEPFMKVYHDTMLFAAQGSKLFSRPKVKFKLQNVQKFLDDNFTAEERKAGKLRFGDKELIFLQKDDEAAFISADSGLEGVTTLLKFIFRCIVDVSETPEFAFGTAVASSKASVSEQMVPLARKIRRKRGLFEESYGELASMYLAMWAKVNNKALDTYDAGIGWDELSPKNDKETADTIKALVEGLVTAMESGLLSLDAAAGFLREFVPSMLPWLDEDADDDERRRVARTMLFRKRIQDEEGWTPEGGEPGAAAHDKPPADEGGVA